MGSAVNDMMINVWVETICACFRRCFWEARHLPLVCIDMFLYINHIPLRASLMTLRN